MALFDFDRPYSLVMLRPRSQVFFESTRIQFLTCKSWSPGDYLLFDYLASAACMPRELCFACVRPNLFIYLFLMILWAKLSRDPPNRF